MKTIRHCLLRQGVWLGVIGLAVVTLVGCNSSTTTTEAQTLSEESSSPGQVATADKTPALAPASEEEVETPARVPAGEDPYALRADPFSEENVQVLEALLRPIEAIPTKTKATLPKDG
jgi:hypothetical protein